ncbi:hypothetical protein [Caminibacter pacificus]
MYKTKHFKNIENYALLDLRVAYESFVDAIVNEVCKRMDVLECKKDEIIQFILTTLSQNKKYFAKEIKFAVMFENILKKIELNDFDYDFLIDYLVDFDCMIENINFRNIKIEK